MTLHDEDVSAANAFCESWPDLSVGELGDADITEGESEVLSYLARKVRMRAP
jgi:hypothetical protein